MSKYQYFLRFNTHALKRNKDLLIMKPKSHF